MVESAANPTDAAPLDYASFGAWYETERENVLEPALAIALKALDAALRETLTERDLARVRSVVGRVKSKRRTWRKVRSPRYRSRIATVDDVVGVIDDLVGLRITCINLRDIELIQTALDALARTPGEGMWLDAGTERDYIAEPKASGYRGWHTNLGIIVGDTPVVCELQVRTLLQDSWGELTHQESYSKDGELPPLVDVLGTRMADLLSILDDVAEDLRTELDRIDQAAVARSAASSTGGELSLGGQGADAAALLRDRWESMDRPLDLAGLAWTLQREFGAEVSDDWFGHGSFKRFLRHAVPDGEITSGRQAYLLPPRPPEVADAESAGESAAGEADTTPGAARQLQRVDPRFPLLSSADWSIAFECLAESWQRVKPAAATAGNINRMTQSARDLARGAGSSITRRNLEYVATTLLTTDGMASAEHGWPSAESLSESFTNAVVDRMIELRILINDSSRAARRVRQWMSGPKES